MKKQDKDHIKKLIDGKDIQQIEAEIEKHIENEAEEDRHKITKLYALQDSKRYRENPLFKKASFALYLYERWHMRENTFEYRCKAYFNFPAFSMKYSPGLTERIIKECTALKAPSVINEITSLAGKRKKALSRADIEKIIDHNRKPKQQKATVTPIPDWRARAERAEKLVIEKDNIIKAQAEQIARLKGTLKEMTERFSVLIKEAA